jgi:outer membrane protein assembly factor BamB
MDYVKNGINFFYPSQWELTENNHTIRLIHKQHIATINLSKREMSPIVTANTLQIERSTTLYDGWMKMLSRKSFENEIERANVEDAHINVFLKQELNSKLSLTEHIVGEYYYIKNNFSYIITVQTLKSNWPYIQSDLKLFLNSFWIGEGTRPEESIIKETTSSWTTPGNINNNNFIHATPQIQKKLELQWEFEINSKNNYASFPMVSKANFLFFLQNNTLTKLNYKTGNIEWSFSIENEVNPHYLAYNSSLVFVISNTPIPALSAYSSDTGEKIYSIKLHKQHSIAKFNSSLGFINDAGTIKAFEIHNGNTVWSKPINATTTTPLIVTEKRLLFQNKNTGEIAAISPINGNEIWTQKPCMLSRDLSLFNSVIFLPIKHSSGADKLLALDINSGDTIWSFDKTILNFKFENTISSSDKVSVFSGTISSIKKDKAFVLICINNLTGKIEWEKVLDEPIYRPIVTKTNLFSISKYTKSILILDLLTGEKIPINTHHLSINDINVYRDYFLKIIIKNNNIIIQCYT